jgi:hypothetical protein
VTYFYSGQPTQFLSGVDMQKHLWRIRGFLQSQAFFNQLAYSRAPVTQLFLAHESPMRLDAATERAAFSDWWQALLVDADAVFPEPAGAWEARDGQNLVADGTGDPPPAADD